MNAFAGRVRPLAPHDRPAWDRLWAGYLEFYKTSLPPEVSQTSWERLLFSEPAMFAFVAEQDGRVIGIVHGVLHPATWSVGPYCYLEDLFVDPAARGSGAGRALIEAVYARADAAGAARVYWMTHKDNPARRLYDQVAGVSEFVQYRR